MAARNEWQGFQAGQQFRIVLPLRDQAGAGHQAGDEALGRGHALLFAGAQRIANSAAWASGESMSLTSAMVVAPPSRKYLIGSTTSGLWPDCEIEMASVSRVISGDLFSVTSDIGSDAHHPGPGGP